MANERTDGQFELHLFAACLDLTAALSAMLHSPNSDAAHEQARETLCRWGGEGADEIKRGGS